MVPPPGQTWGLASPGPAPPPPCWKPGRLRQGRRSPKDVALSTALQGTVLSCRSVCLSVSPGPDPLGCGSGWRLRGGGGGDRTEDRTHLSLSYSWPHACSVVFLSLSPRPPIPAPSVSVSPAPAVLPRPCLPVPISLCLAGGWGSGLLCLLSLGLSIPCLGLIWLLAQPPHPSLSSLRLPEARRLSLSSPFSILPPAPPTSLSPEPSAPAQTGSETAGGGDGAAPSPGGGGGGRRGRPLTWPRPCRPPPHQPGFIKQTGPYIARPRGPGSPRPPYMARRLRAALGPAPGGGGRRRDPARARAPAPPAPSSSREDPPTQDPMPAPQLPRCTLGKATPGPRCSPLSNGAGTPVLAALTEHSSELKFTAPEKLNPTPGCVCLGGRVAAEGDARILALQLPYVEP